MTVDYRHWEIRSEGTGLRDQLIELVTRIRQLVIAGEDRLRWVGILSQEEHWRRFQALAASQVIEEARRRCGWKLSKATNPKVTDPRQIEAELKAEEPLLPDQCISPLAEEKYRLRCENNTPGSDTTDWDKAVEELREQYRQGILQMRG